MAACAGRWTRPLRRLGVVGAPVQAVIVAAGCSAAGASLESAPAVLVWSVGAALHRPVWSYRMHTAEVRPGAHRDDAKTRLSAPLAMGRNLQISRKDDRVVFVLQPGRGRVAVVDLDSLRQVADFDAGPAPAYLTEDAALPVLLALSADGRSVTPVDQYGFRKLPTAGISGAPADTIDGANRGREMSAAR